MIGAVVVGEKRDRMEMPGAGVQCDVIRVGR